MMTSISEADFAYPAFCQMAAQTDVFHTFKTNSNYNKILEHCTPNQGFDYLRHIEEKFLPKLEKYADFDKIGGGKTYDYFGKQISPNTLRYVKVMSDIEDMFGSLNGRKILEIGVGYGGQCKVLLDEYDVLSYTLVDLPEALDLSKRYLSYHGEKDKVRYLNGKAKLPRSNDWDLIISNYAISECSQEVQENYLKRLVSKCKMGYITYNEIGDVFNMNCMKCDEFVKRLWSFGLKVETKCETPDTFRGNKLIFWKG